MKYFPRNHSTLSTIVGTGDKKLNKAGPVLKVSHAWKCVKLDKQDSLGGHELRLVGKAPKEVTLELSLEG